MGAAAAALVGAVALSGCGVTGTDIRPGVAAKVGDDSITVQEVDETASGVCAYFKDDETDIPLAFYRSQILQVLVREAATRQVVSDVGAKLAAGYDDAAKQVVENYADLPAAQREAFVKIDTAAAYIHYGELAAALAVGESTGETAVSPQEASEQGATLIQEWLLGEDVELNPMFGVVLGEDGALNGGDTSLSVAVSDEAVQAILPDDEDTEYVSKVAPLTETLTDQQVC